MAAALRLITLPLTGLLLASNAHGQAVTTASLYGTVSGIDTIPMENAQVSVTNLANGERWKTTTRADGRYHLEYLSVGGPYVIEARAIGFEPARQSSVFLSIAERQKTDFRLVPSVYTLPELAVSAAADRWANAGRTGPAQTLTDTLISRLPIARRHFSELIFLSPQAVPTLFGGVSLAGQTDRLNGLQIDGATNLDLAGYAGGIGVGTPGGASGVRTLSVEAVRELQIAIAPFDVRFGTFAAGLVNAVTRSGSNRWEGSLTGYFENESLTGKDAFGGREEDFSNTDWTLTLGGPVVRDRAAFFLDLGRQRDVIPQSAPAIGTDTVGGADSAGIGIRHESVIRFQRILREGHGVEAGSFAATPQRVPSGNFFGKITLQPALNHRIEVSHNYGRGNPEHTGTRGNDGYSLSSNFNKLPATIHATRLTWTMAGNGPLSNELSVAHLRVRERCRAASAYPQVQVAADAGLLIAGQTPFCEDTYSNQRVWELTDNLSWLAGAHQLTFGTHNEFIGIERKDVPNSLGLWEFASLDAFEAGVPEAYFRSLPGPLGARSGLGDFDVSQLGLYVQDRWMPTSRLAVTAGIRMDVPFVSPGPPENPLLRSELGIDNTRSPSGNVLWSPRIGVNYDVTGRGTSYVRGGLGLFAGRPAYHWFKVVHSQTGLGSQDLFCADSEVPTFTLVPEDQPTTCGEGPFEPTAQANYFDPSFRFPRNLRLALGADLRLPWGLVGTVDLLFIRGVNQLYLMDVNLDSPTATSTGEDGRLLYGTIDPASGEAFPSRPSDAFGSVIEVRNASGDRALVATGQLQKRLPGGTEVGLAYTYTYSRDRLSAHHDLHEFNLGEFALDGPLDDRRLRTSIYSVPHKITAYGAVDLPLRFNFSLVYNGYSGPAFTYRISGDANADGVMAFGGQFAFDNDPVYVPRDAADITLADPAQYDALDRFIRSTPCLGSQRGKLLHRNSCRNPWINELNARLSKLFPTVGGQSVELIADLFNVLNLIDEDWGVVRGIDSSRLLELVGYDEANSRGVYRVNLINREATDLTRWRVQLGARYSF